MESRISDPIAERHLSVDDDPERVVVLTIGRPVPDPAGDWMCPYLVEGLGEGAVQYAHGLDALQALQLAIDGARIDLAAFGLTLTWEGGEPGDAGIPRIVPMFLPRPFALAAERCIQGQIEEFSRAAQALEASRGGHQQDGD